MMEQGEEEKKKDGYSAAQGVSVLSVQGGCVSRDKRVTRKSARIIVGAENDGGAKSMSAM